MGGCYSCKPSTTFNNIRVVHLNGYYEDYEYPTTVSQVIANFPKHFLCTPAQLLRTGLMPLKPHTQLNSGSIYFLLPYSTLQFDASPVDLASISRKLTNIAKTGGGGRRFKSAPASPSASPLCSSPLSNSHSSSPSLFMDWCTSVGLENGTTLSYGMHNSYKSPSWKPILATIRERSFNRRSESDLREIHSEILNNIARNVCEGQYES